MANSKKLKKAAAKFRRTESELHALCSDAINYMANFIKKSGAPEVVVKMHGTTIVNAYANE